MNYFRIGFLCVCSLLANAQDQATQSAPAMTKGVSNGRFWREMGDDTKLVWLVAYREGLMRAAAGFTAPPDANAVSETMRTLYPRLAYSEIRSALDRFYETPENRPIPIGEGMMAVVMSASGIEQSVIDGFISTLRRGAPSQVTK
jgi:hypothetical protein